MTVGSMSTEVPLRSVPTLEEVAERAGVSRSTASRAINGGLRVSPEALASVEAAVAELGYTPNRAARSLVTKRTDSIALVVPEPDERVLTDPFFAGTLTGLSSALATSDLQLVLLIARPGDNARTLRYLRNGHVDGAVVVSHHRDDSITQTLLEARVPCVFIGRPLVQHQGVQYVDVDNVRGAKMATEHLIAQGRTRIATIAGPEDMPAGIDRLEGWRVALREAGMPEGSIVHGDFTIEGGAVAAQALLTADPTLDAIFIASDMMAVGAMQHLADLGRAVPADVAIVGYDNLGLAATAHPPLTTVVNPVIAMARAAGDFLLDQLTGSATASRTTIFAPELIIRASS
jgi:DNA-binding LacI/PurR family transcriptional regulator